MHSSCEQPNCGRCSTPDGSRRLILSHHLGVSQPLFVHAARRGQQVALLHRGCENLQFVGQIFSQFYPCGSCPKEAGTYNIVVGLGGVLFACYCPPATEFNPEKQLRHLILFASTCERVLNPPHFWASKHPWFDGLGALLGLAPKVSRRDSRCFLKSLITNKRITAPITALMIAATRPRTRTNPIRGKSQPAITAPIMPTTMLPMSPKPSPFMMRPAS